MCSLPSLSAIQVLTLFVFWGQIQNYMMRTNLSILIVAMVKEPRNKSSNFNNLTCSDNLISTDTTSSNVTEEQSNESIKFDWGPFEQGQILAAFSYGYIATQIIGGRLAERFGSKKVYGGALFLTGIVTFLLPAAAKLGSGVFIALRILQGVLEGASFPSLHALTARWIPPSKRNTFIAGSYFGSVFSKIITYPMCGALADEYGWESAFYVIGGITTIWFILWCIFVFDSPDLHPRISQKEKDFITNELKEIVNDKEVLPIPWKSILTSIPFIGLIITDFANGWGIITIGVFLPTYMKNVQQVDLKQNGVLSALPFPLRYFGGVILCKIADIVLQNKILSTTNIRRLFNSIALVPPAIALVMIGFATGGLECNTNYVVILFCLGMFFNGAFSAGHFSSHLDLAPNFAGTLMGISNTFAGGVAGFVVPTIIGAIRSLEDYDIISKWKIIFGTAAGLYFIGNLFYVLMITGEIQEWNYGPKGRQRHEGRKEEEEELKEL